MLMSRSDSFRADPFRALFDFQRALDSSLKGDWLRGSTAGRGGFPAINVFQKGDDFVAVVELPGVDKDSLDIEAKDNLIRLSGKMQASHPDGASVHRRERVSGGFDRTISVPVRVDASGIKAEYRDGILALYIPRAEQDKPRKVQIG